MNRLIMRWKMEFLKPNPFSPVQSTLKFSAVFGTTLAKSSKVILWVTLFNPMSKKTIGFPWVFFEKERSAFWAMSLEVSCFFSGVNSDFSLIVSFFSYKISFFISFSTAFFSATLLLPGESLLLLLLLTSFFGVCSLLDIFICDNKFTFIAKHIFIFKK